VLEAINTAATVATFVVLTAGAIAAAFQLRHMRTGNQLQAFIEIYSRAQSAEMQQYFDTVLRDFPRLTHDSQYMQQFETGSYRVHDNPLMLAFWFDEVGVALREGLVNERVLFQIAASANTAVLCWRNMLPVIEIIRKRAPSAFIHFEYAAVRAQQWLDAHPDGDYPPGAPRWKDLEL
jgi:hypothetical protein